MTPTDSHASTHGPLRGVKVLALENYLAGNYGSFFLSLFGADVVKVEQPGVGDALRTNGPFVEGADGSRRSIGEFRVMGNKRSIGIDLTRDEGIELLMALVGQFDVVWTNMKPSSLERMGITYERLRAANPRIIYSSLSGFGHSDVLPNGPYENWPAFDIIAQGLAGLQFRAQGEGDEPGYNGLALGDHVTALLLAAGTVMALYRRERSGEGARVDVAMHDAMISLNELAVGLQSLVGITAPRGRSGTSAPYGAFRTADGWVNIAVGGNAVWRRFCQAIERPELAEDPRLADPSQRIENFELLDELVTGWTCRRSTDEVVSQLHSWTVPSAPVHTVSEALESEQVTAREMLIAIDDPELGLHRIAGNPVKISEMTSSTARPASRMGADTRAVLFSECGLSGSDLDRLEALGVIEASSTG